MRGRSLSRWRHEREELEQVGHEREELEQIHLDKKSIKEGCKQFRTFAFFATGMTSISL